MKEAERLSYLFRYKDNKESDDENENLEKQKVNTDKKEKGNDKWSHDFRSAL